MSYKAKTTSNKDKTHVNTSLHDNTKHRDSMDSSNDLLMAIKEDVSWITIAF